MSLKFFETFTKNNDDVSGMGMMTQRHAADDFPLGLVVQIKVFFSMMPNLEEVP